MFSAFIGLGIAEQMLTITEQIGQQSGEFMDSLFSTSNYDIATIEFLLLVVVLINAVLSAMMIRIMDRGHFVSGLTHYVMLVWTGALVASVTRIVVRGLMG
jgi:flagellar protein FlaJ